MTENDTKEFAAFNVPNDSDNWTNIPDSDLWLYHEPIKVSDDRRDLATLEQQPTRPVGEAQIPANVVIFTRTVRTVRSPWERA